LPLSRFDAGGATEIENIEELQGHEILEIIGKKRGMLISGGEINTERAAITVLDEFRSAKLGRITLEHV
jgi:ribosome biogenesis GTPase A